MIEWEESKHGTWTGKKNYYGLMGGWVACIISWRIDCLGWTVTSPVTDGIMYGDKFDLDEMKKDAESEIEKWLKCAGLEFKK